LRDSAIEAIGGGETGASNAITATGMSAARISTQAETSSSLYIVAVLLRRRAVPA
jgi:hypothetical protein